MHFNSVQFMFAFLPVVLLAFWAIRRLSVVASSAWLAAASLGFYWLGTYLGLNVNVPLLLGSIAFNFLVGFGIFKLPRWSKAILIFGVSVDLLILGYFKYAGFILDEIAAPLGASFALDVPRGVNALPIGISFYTFTQIAYLVDTYQRKVRDQDPVNYALFVTWFPHLISGPILHHKEMMPQFADRTNRRKLELLAVGIAVFTIGLVKKVFLADPVALHASPIFAAADAGEAITMASAWVAALAYTLQLYFDFSGYCDMAVGISFMFGVRLPINFYSPYKATSIVEFWRRWHMTLSRFLRDYLYIPLGGNRKGPARRWVNLFITMVLGGLWHGAGWTFLVWGALHGVYLGINHAFRSFGGRLPAVIAWALTFLAVVVGWVFFRAQTVDGALSLLKAMVGSGMAGTVDWLAVVHIAALMAVVLALPNAYQMLARWQPALLPRDTEEEIGQGSRLRISLTLPQGMVAGIAVAVSVFMITRQVVPSEFLYFQF